MWVQVDVRWMCGCEGGCEGGCVGVSGCEGGREWM